MASHGNVRAFQESQAKNDLVLMAWINRLVELSIAAFEWINVPDSIDMRYVERTLCYKGSVVWFREEVTGELICLQGVTQGQFDIYGNPQIRQAVGYNGYTRTVDSSNSVLMWNNYQRYPSYPVLLNYARQLADIDRTIEVNTNGQKSPIIIQCTKDQYLTLKNIELKKDGNQRYIYIDNDLNPDVLKTIDMTVPFLGDKLSDLKSRIWADALSYIGIPANSIEKAERINLLELELSNASTDAQRSTRLLTRKEACKKINERFGTNLDVRCRFGDNINKEGGETDGRIYGRTSADSDELPSAAKDE